MSNITAPDRRLNVYREDLADISLKELVSADRYVEGKPANVISTTVSIKKEPRFDGALETEALSGETAQVFEDHEGWAWVQLDRDGYVGYMSSEALSYQTWSPTHRVASLRTFVYPAPNIKTVPLKTLCMNSTVEVLSEEGNFLKCSDGGYIYSRHMVPVSEHESDFVQVARRYEGTPYLWGGCSSLGIDCSGLVQQSLKACGIDAPRDSDMQEKQLGQLVGQDFQDIQFLKGDLVFWKGHVGIMLDSERLIHANGFHMSTVVEPVHGAIQRIADMYGTVTSVKRMDKFV